MIRAIFEKIRSWLGWKSPAPKVKTTEQMRRDILVMYGFDVDSKSDEYVAELLSVAANGIAAGFWHTETRIEDRENLMKAVELTVKESVDGLTGIARVGFTMNPVITQDNETLVDFGTPTPKAIEELRRWGVIGDTVPDPLILKTDGKSWKII